MKKITLLFSALAATFAVSAQTFVSTTATTKSVVLEEYTGIRCGYCPDGHKRANDFAKANPGRVVLVNIHTGSYAAARAGSPDYTTAGGDQIAGHPNVDIAGYPAGSVQRRIFANPQGSGTASSRGVWARDGAIVLAEASPVNVALKATYDNTKQEVSVVVEAYYTASSSAATNKITVGITQDGLTSTQSGAAANPDNIQPDGSYMHLHMLRDYITATFGESIGATTMGTFFTKTYTWPVPADIKGNPVAVQNLNAFVIIAEGDQKILTGAEGKVELPANLRTDLSVAANISEPTGMCNGDLTPSFEVENKDVNDITAFKMSYTLNGGTPVVETYTGTLKKGQKTTVAFPKITLAPGSNNTITYQRPYDISGGLIDVNGGALASGKYTVVMQKAFDKTVATEDFSNVADLNSFAPNWIPYAEGKLEGRTYVSSTVGNNVSSKGKGYWISLSWGDVGDKAGIMIGEIDKSVNNSAILTFSSAYAEINTGGGTDKLSVLVSDDCGATWKSAWSKSGAALSPYGASTSAIMVPTNDDNWKNWEVDLSSFGNNLLVKLEVETAKGNSMFLDDIGIRMTKTNFTSITENSNSSGISISPNPTSNVTVISFNGNDMNGSVLSVIDVTGKIIVVKTIDSNEDVQLDVTNFNAGVYNVQVSSEAGVSTSRIVVQ